MDDLGSFSLSIKQCVEPPKQQQQLLAMKGRNKTSTEYYSEVKKNKKAKKSDGYQMGN